MIDWINGLTGDQWPLWVGWLVFLYVLAIVFWNNDRRKK